MFVCLFFSFLGVERGKIDFQQMGIGLSQCENVSFSSSFSSGTSVRIFASVNHGNESSGVHDSAFIWVEDVTTSSFRACLVQGGRGTGGDATIDWFAFQGSQSGVYHGEESFSLFTTGAKCSQLAFPQVRLSVQSTPDNLNLQEKKKGSSYRGFELSGIESK